MVASERANIREQIAIIIKHGLVVADIAKTGEPVACTELKTLERIPVLRLGLGNVLFEFNLAHTSTEHFGALWDWEEVAGLSRAGIAEVNYVTDNVGCVLIFHHLYEAWAIPRDKSAAGVVVGRGQEITNLRNCLCH